MPTETPEPAPETWAIVSQFGHTTHAGRLSEVEMFGEKFGRIDIPQPDGSFRTRLFGGKSVFDIEIVTEAAAREEAKRSYPVAVRPWGEPKALPTAGHAGYSRYDDDHDDDGRYDDREEG